MARIEPAFTEIWLAGRGTIELTGSKIGSSDNNYPFQCLAFTSETNKNNITISKPRQPSSAFIIFDCGF